MTWLHYLIPAILLFAVLNTLQRKVATDSSDPRSTAVIFNGIATILATLLFFLTGDYRSLVMPHTISPWVFLSLACLCYGIFERYRFTAAKHLEASVQVVIYNWSFVVAFIGILLVYRESVTIPHLIGSALILFSVVLVSMPNKSKVSVTKIGLFYGLLTSSAMGMAQVFDKSGAMNFSPGFYSIIVWLTPLIVVSFPMVQPTIIKRGLRISAKVIFLLALINVAGYFLLLKAYELASAVQVVPITQLYSVLTVILAAVFLKERSHIILKLTACVLAIFGLQLLL